MCCGDAELGLSVTNNIGSLVYSSPPCQHVLVGGSGIGLLYGYTRWRDVLFGKDARSSATPRIYLIVNWVYYQRTPSSWSSYNI